MASLPILTVLVMLGALRRPAWQASLAGLIVGLVVAVGVWRMPPGLAAAATLNGVAFALWPVMWIVVNAMLLYNIAVTSGHFDAFRRWTIDHLPNDRRIVLVAIGFCFGALLEGVAGFGAPVAIASSLLILVGFAPLEALVYVLIFNTAPVAFGALGAPVTVLAAVTGLPANVLAAMIGRQLPFMALILPFYVMAFYGGARSVRATWPALLAAGGSFAVCQFLASNYIDYSLTDVLASLGSLIVTLGFLKVWRPTPDPEFAIVRPDPAAEATSGVPAWQGWAPWLIVVAVVIVWTWFKIFAIGQIDIPGPASTRRSPSRSTPTNPTLRSGSSSRSHPAPQSWRPGSSPRWSPASAFGGYVSQRQADGAADLARARHRLPDRRPRLSDELFRPRLHARQRRRLGRRAVRAAVAVPRLDRGVPVRQRHLGQRAVRQSAGRRRQAARLSPVLFAAANSSGGVMAKMISPQNIATGVSVTDLKGREGEVFARTFPHSVVLTLLFGLLVALQQFVIPWIIPAVSGP